MATLGISIDQIGSQTASPARVKAAMLVDFSLIEKAREGDDAAFGQIVQAYRRRILGTISRLISRREDVEDVGQEVFLRLYHSLDQLREPEVFEPWLYRLTVNAAYDYLRRQKRRPEARMSDLSEQQVVLADATANPKAPWEIAARAAQYGVDFAQRSARRFRQQGEVVALARGQEETPVLVAHALGFDARIEPRGETVVADGPVRPRNSMQRKARAGERTSTDHDAALDARQRYEHSAHSFWRGLQVEGPELGKVETLRLNVDVHARRRQLDFHAAIGVLRLCKALHASESVGVRQRRAELCHGNSSGIDDLHDDRAPQTKLRSLS